MFSKFILSENLGGHTRNHKLHCDSSGCRPRQEGWEWVLTGRRTLIASQQHLIWNDAALSALQKLNSFRTEKAVITRSLGCSHLDIKNKSQPASLSSFQLGLFEGNWSVNPDNSAHLGSTLAEGRATTFGLDRGRWMWSKCKRIDSEPFPWPNQKGIE